MSRADYQFASEREYANYCGSQLTESSPALSQHSDSSEFERIPSDELRRDAAFSAQVNKAF